MKIEEMNGSMLAFVGDSYYDLKIREMLIRRGINKSKKFHQLATFYVSAKGQAKVLHQLIADDFLSEVELGIVKRGRNTNSGSIPKNTDVATYRQSSAFEALIGFLYLTKQFERLDDIITRGIEIREEGESND